jgi:integrase/recombinase XerC
MIREFKNWLRYEKRSSEHTVVSYINDLEQFESFLKETYAGTVAEDTQPAMIKTWIIGLMNEKYSPASINRKIVSLNTYFKFLIREEKISVNPVKNIQGPKKGKRIVKYLEEDEILKILDELQYEDDFDGIRNRLIIEMLYGTGIRLSEIIGLKVSETDINGGFIKVLGKRSKERIIPMNRTLNELVSKYMEKRREVPGAVDKDVLFLTGSGNNLYPMFVYRVVKQYVDKMILRTHVSPHVLRHTFATHLINRGADINAIKELLGHANLSATQIYTHNTVERLKKVYKQAHPRG